MPDKVIAKSDLRQWLTSLAADYNVVAPVDSESGPKKWASIDTAEGIDVAGNKLTMSAKEVLLPVYDSLFKYKGRKGEESLEMPEMPEKPTLMAGLRLCDVRAISVLDGVYLKGQFKDPYYAARRENLALIATVCDDPRWSCFCTSVGNIEEWSKGADVLITDLGDKIYVAPMTETGEKMVQGSFFKDVTPEESKKKDEVWTNLTNMPKRSFAGTDISKTVSWDDPIWQEIADKCLGCGACTYLCPSCTCFDIQDESKGHTVERFRCRDTCQFTDFTLMGHGHNPRPEKTMRMRQRVMHKFKYQMEQFELTGCTGCGRCVESCPVNIDLRDVLDRVAAQK